MSISISKRKFPNLLESQEPKPIYDKQVQLYLHKKYLSVINQTLYEEKLENQRLYEEVRRQNPERKEYLRSFDEVRRQNPERKEYNRGIDEVRSKDENRKSYKRGIDEVRRQNPERKKYNRVIDQVRYEDEERQEYIKEHVNKQYQRKLISTYTTDTGFDQICACCLQYKSAYACKSIDVLSSKQQKEYTVKACKLLKNRNEGLSICKPCLSDISKGKMPKKSHRNSFKFANLKLFL